MSLRPPTQDAKSCFEKMFQYLELHIRNRVSAKIGANQTLDMGALSNINQLAAASHRNKTKSVISSARSRNIDIAVDIAANQKSKLRETFIYYCSWGEQHNYLWMSRSQFIKFARDCHLTELGGWDSTHLTILFEKVRRDATNASPGVRFSLVDWLQALLTMSMRIYPDMSPQEAFDKIVDQRVLPVNAANHSLDDPLAEVMLLPEVLDILGAAAGPLDPVFKYYVNDQDFINLEKSGATVWDIQAARHRLPFPSFIAFAQDFQILPSLLTRPQLSKAFKLAKFGNTKADLAKDDMGRLSFQEFIDCIGRCALIAFNYQEPPPQPAALSFTNSYHPQAKAIWQGDGTQSDLDSISFPDEISLPSAKSFTEEELTAVLDVDEGPDGWSLRNATAAASRSRTSGVGGGPRTAMTASRSVAPSVKPVTLQNGAESLTIHDEITSLPAGDKPLHLQQFSNDWVGRPPSPTSDPPTMRVGLTSTQAKPVDKREAAFDAKKTQMIDARMTREQHLAALQLQCSAERREQMRGQLKDTAARREQLQAASGQRPSPAVTQRH